MYRTRPRLRCVCPDEHHSPGRDKGWVFPPGRGQGWVQARRMMYIGDAYV